jgi:cytochrome b561
MRIEMSEFVKEAAPRHSMATRIFHGALALAIISQLVTSLVMEGPDEESTGDALFQVHRYAGLAAMVLALGLWLVILGRRRGTAFGALFPWFSWVRLSAVGRDIGHYVKAVTRLRLPEPDIDSPLASAVHGLGLLLMTAMALSGTLYFIQVNLGLHSPEPDDMPVMLVHFALANLVWVYLIAHASLAVFHHLLRTLPLGSMWSLRG